jgi:hypothetical protein
MVEKVNLNFRKSHNPELVEFKQGSRNMIHPSFSEIDNLDCNFLYNKQQRFFIVDYAPVINSGTKIYTRTIMSNNIKYIIECVKELQECPLI